METVDVKLPAELLRVANLEESSLSQEALDCWPSNFIARIRSRSDAPLSYARRRWQPSWTLRQSTVSPRCGTALRTWKKNARLLTVSTAAADRRSRAKLRTWKLRCTSPTTLLSGFLPLVG